MQEYKNSSLILFTERWLSDSDTVVTLEGFKLVKVDRRLEESGKKRGGGLAVYINEMV